MRSHIVTAVAGLVALSASAFAQTDGIVQAPQAKAVPGQLPGTESWIAHFKTRPFTLNALQAELQGAADPDRTDRIVADLEARMRAHQQSFVNEIKALGGRVTHQFWIVNCAAFEIAPKDLPAVRALKNIDFLQPNEAVRPLIKVATNKNNHNSDAVNAKGGTGAGVAYAIIDTGQDENMAGSGKPHITYSRRGTSTTRLVKNKKLGAVSADDVHGHGTGVASIAGGWKWRNAGADNGHAHDANIVGYSIANNSRGSSTLALEAMGYQNAAADSARFKIVATNLSYSGSSNPVSVEQKAMDVAARVADLLNATAAGNSGSSVRSSLSNINGISVGAVSGNSHVVARFSSRGIQGGRLFPNMCSNGVSTVMARRDNETGNFVASGTSMASPQVCGAATLIRAANRSMKSDETRAVLLASTEKNPGAGAGLNSTGTGAGYLRDDWAYDIATTARLHGRQALSATTKTWRKVLLVQAKHTVQIAIAWQRLNENLTTWSNLDVTLKRGATVVATSATKSNTEEFIRYVPATNGALILEVKLVGGVVGGSTQPFGWATFFSKTATKVPGKYVLFGSGCKGTGKVIGGGPVVPAGYDKKWGEINNIFPLSRANQRYQQAHAKADVTTRIINGIAVRGDERFTQLGDRIKLLVKMGHTTKSPRALSTSFASNVAGPQTTTFNGTLAIPAAGRNTNLANFATKIAFTRPFIYLAPRGNLLIEMANMNTSVRRNIFDATNSAAAQTGRLFASPVTATTGRFLPGQAVVFRLLGSGSSGAIVRLTNTGVPEIGNTFKVNLSQAATNTVAVLYLGVNRLNLDLTNIGMPGCRLYQSLNVLLGGVPTGASGSGSLTFGTPNAAALVGVRYFNQYIVIDRGANSVGLVTTNGGAATIGG